MAARNKDKRSTARKVFLDIPDVPGDGTQTSLYDYLEGGTLAALVETAEGRKLNKNQRVESERREYERVTGRTTVNPNITVVEIPRPEYTDTEEWITAIKAFGELASMRGRSAHIDGRISEEKVCEACVKVLCDNAIGLSNTHFPSSEEFWAAYKILQEERLF